MPKKSKKLEDIKNMMKNEETINGDEIENFTINTEFICSIKENACYIVDERVEGYVIHSIESIILSVIFAILAECNTFKMIHLFMQLHYEWLDKHIHFESGLPSLSTVTRVIGNINPKELEYLCKKSIYSFLEKNAPIYRKGFFVIEDIISIDGKTANSSGREKSKDGKVSKVNAMSAYSEKTGSCLATEFIDSKTNEIPTGPILLSQLNIKNSIVVFDAMSTQRETIKYIIKNKGHYIAPVKGNQGELEEQIVTYFNDEEFFLKAKKESYYEVKEKAHGTFEKREYIFTNDVSWLFKKDEWSGLKSIGIAIRTYENNKGKTVCDKRYFISDLTSDKIDVISKAIRSEWSIENKLHYYLDMVFKEDDNKSFVNNSQKNLNIIRKMALTILKNFREKEKIKESLNSIRYIISASYEKGIDKVINSLYKD